MDSNDSNDSNDGFQCIAMDFNGLQWIPCSVIQIISSSPSLEVCRSPACSQRQTSTHSPTARSSAQTNICLSESRVPQNPMVDYMNCIIFIHFSHSNNYGTCGTCTFWVSLILRQDMMVTHLQRALMSSTLMFLRPRVVNTWKGRIFLLTWSYATSSLSMMQLSTSWTFRTRQMVKKNSPQLEKAILFLRQIETYCSCKVYSILPVLSQGFLHNLRPMLTTRKQCHQQQY